MQSSPWTQSPVAQWRSDRARPQRVPRIWTKGNGYGWIGAIGVMVIISCEITAAAWEARCITLPAWADPLAMAFLPTAVVAAVGCLRRRAWGSVAGVAAGCMGIALSSTDLSIVPWWGATQVSAFAVLAAWGALSLRAQRGTVADAPLRPRVLAPAA